MGQRTGAKVGVDLLDDRVPSVVLLGLEECQRAVAEHGVVTAGGEQLALLGTGRAAGRTGLASPAGAGAAGLAGVEASDSADREPAGDLLVLAAAGESGEAGFGDLGVAD